MNATLAASVNVTAPIDVAAAVAALAFAAILTPTVASAAVSTVKVVRLPAPANEDSSVTVIVAPLIRFLT